MLSMAEIIKTIPVSGKEQAIRVMNALTDKYDLILTDPDNSLDTSNEKFHAYYDADRQRITIETNDADSVGEHLKELLADFPTFF